MDFLFFDLLAAGYVPILTHPERLTWIERHYESFVRLVRAGAWMQVTSGSLTGAFGRRPKYWAERMLNDGLVHILASDAHGARRRPPDLALGRAVAAKWLGEAEAEQLVSVRPRAILENAEPSDVRAPPGAEPGGAVFEGELAEGGAESCGSRSSRRSGDTGVYPDDPGRRGLPGWLSGVFRGARGRRGKTNPDP